MLDAALNVFKIASGVGTVATLGEVIGKRVGIIKEDTSLLRDGANLAIELLGAPRGKAVASSGNPAEAPPAIGDANSEPAEPRVICTECQIESDMPLISGASGEQIYLAQCQKHYELEGTTADQVGALYDGWYNSLGLSEADVCGARPKIAAYKKYVKMGKKRVAVPNATAFIAALSKWQQCVAKMKEGAATEAQQAASAAHQQEMASAKKKQSAQAMRAALALSAQKKRYEEDIAALEEQMALEKDAQKQAEMQAKIDQATAAKEAAEKLVDDMKQSAKDADMQAKLAELQAKIAAQATQPSGIDSFIQMMMANQLAQQQAPVAVPPQAPVQYVDPMAMLAPMSPMAMTVPMDSPGPFDYSDPLSLYGADDDAPLDEEMAQLLGVPKASTIGEARAAFDLMQSGFSEDELDSAFDDVGQRASSCSLGSCNAL